MILSASKGEHIVRYQNLFAQYSRLGLTRPSDRPYAIDGLQTRLLRAFRTTEGGFGLIDEGPAQRGHLRRSLLWQRGEEVERLEPIDFSGTTGVRPPSWSWMAYTGGIDYLEPEFNKTVWKHLASPWTRPGWSGAPTRRLLESQGGGGGGGFTLEGMAQKFNRMLLREPGEALLVFDRREEVDNPSLRCVVLGVVGEGNSADETGYVLVVKPLNENDKLGCWVRVGAGYLKTRWLEGQQIRIVIC